MRSYTATGIVLAFALVFVGASVFYTNRLAAHFAAVEQERMEIWAEATRRLVVADEQTDISFYSSIIEANTTIPVYMTDDAYQVLLTRNVQLPRTNVEAYYAKRIASLRERQEPIEVVISPTVKQYIFYEESRLLRQLRLFPLVQIGVLVLFMLVLVFYIVASYRSEQDRVWVGLTKETAHQLGTPISSLNGWLELLKGRYPDDDLLPETAADVQRLQMVAERFSKIGSTPTLREADMAQIVRSTYAYMRARVSEKVAMQLEIAPEHDYTLQADEPLMQWVIENVIKNAVDAMDGRGCVSLHLFVEADRDICLDVSDTGKGMNRQMYRRVFMPGYTTKQRGWGLGLSLCKRIVEDYHGGKIFVKQSAIGHGTTFRIILKKSVHR